MEITGNELFLHHDEFIYLVRAVGSHTIIGMDIPQLNAKAEQIEDMLIGAERSLEKSGAIEISKEKGININKQVMDAIKTVSFRDLAIVIIRGINGKGHQLFVHNFMDGRILEHTLPKENLHRLAFLSDRDAFFERLKMIIPLNSVLRENRNEFVIKEKIMNEMINSVQKGETEKPSKVLEAIGMNEMYQSAFIQALADPRFSVSVAAFSMKGESIIDTSSFSIFADEKSSWGVWPHKLSENDSEFLIFASGINDVFSACNDWMASLSQSSE